MTKLNPMMIGYYI